MIKEERAFLKIPDFKENEDFIFQAEKDSIHNKFRIFKNTNAIVQYSTKYVKIESPLIKYYPDKKRIDPETGRVIIYDKTTNGGKIRTDVYYKKLILLKKDDYVGLRVLLREIKKTISI